MLNFVVRTREVLEATFVQVEQEYTSPDFAPDCSYLPLVEFYLAFLNYITEDTGTRKDVAITLQPSQALRVSIILIFSVQLNVLEELMAADCRDKIRRVGGICEALTLGKS